MSSNQEDMMTASSSEGSTMDGDIVSKMEQLHVVDDIGDPAHKNSFMDCEKTDDVTPEMKPMKSILKNRDQRSPVAPDALNYNGPVEADQGLNLRDNNYDEDTKFAKLVDFDLKKFKTGNLKRRRRNTSIESAPELSFRPKRLNEWEWDRDDSDKGKDGKNNGGGPTYKKPPQTV